MKQPTFEYVDWTNKRKGTHRSIHTCCCCCFDSLAACSDVAGVECHGVYLLWFGCEYVLHYPLISDYNSDDVTYHVDSTRHPFCFPFIGHDRQQQVRDKPKGSVTQGRPKVSSNEVPWSKLQKGGRKRSKERDNSNSDVFDICHMMSEFDNPRPHILVQYMTADYFSLTPLQVLVVYDPSSLRIARRN